MPDNTTINPGVGGDTVRDKDRSGVKTQVFGLDLNIGGGSETLMTGSMPTHSGLTGIFDGRKIVTTAGTRVTLAASTACKRVTVVAETDNTGTIVVGGTTVVAALATRQGVPLLPGDAYELEIDNLNDVNIDSTVNGDGVTFSYFT